MRCLFSVTIFTACLGASVSAGNTPSVQDLEFFEKNIRPVLVERCYDCHSATAKKVKGGLLLDTREGLLKGGDTGPALIAGNAEESLIIQAVRRLDKDIAMPPKDALPQKQVEDFIAWVKMGAPDPREGTSVASTDTAKPAIDYAAERKKWAYRKPERPEVPAVKDAGWVKTPVDAFILAKLEAAGLKPAAPADKSTLLRRVTFDLTGLPPTPAEVADFLKDESPGAYEKVVERLLASPHYGEQWGRHWLDVMRYTDSFDSRDTGRETDVMDAWRFREWVVNAYNKDLPYNQFITEQLAGDILAEKEWDPEKVVATGAFAVGNWGNGDSDKQKVYTDIVDDQIDVIGRTFLGLTIVCARCHDHKFDPITNADYYALSGIFFSSRILEHFQQPTTGEKPMRIPLVPAADREKFQKIKQRIVELEKRLAPGLSPLTEVWRDSFGQAGLMRWSMKETENPSMLVNTTNAEIKRDTFKMRPKSIILHPGLKKPATAAWVAPADGKVKVQLKIADVDATGGDGASWALYQAGQWVAGGDMPNGGTMELPETEITVKAGEIVRATIGRGPGDNTFDSTDVEYILKTEDGKVWDLREDLVNGATQGLNNIWWICEGEDSRLGEPAANVPALEAEKKSLNEKLAHLPMCQGLQEGGIPDTVWAGFNDGKIHVRGRYDRLGEVKPRAFPVLLAGDQQPPIKEGSGRLQLAQWLTNGENPLTARVMANRIWQHHFSEGIVRTVNNYGKLGTPPSHPELLDWLATEFMSGKANQDAKASIKDLQPWGIKAMHRLVLLSNTYQQSSFPSAATLKADAANQLFSRQNRRRLSAEETRDTLLKVAGSLDEKIGGAPVKELTDPRRTLYVTTIRSNRATYQLLFDGADPSSIVEKRTDSVVAPQALWMLNHPLAVSQTEALCKRMEQEAPAGTNERIDWLYHLLFSRAPRPEESKLCARAVPNSNTDEWTQLCQVLLCSNEFSYLD